MEKKTAVQAIACVLAFAIAGGAQASSTGGGTVGNEVPTLGTLASTDTSGNPASEFNTGDVGLIAFTVTDTNGVSDLAQLKATIANTVNVDETYTLPSTIPASEPGSFDEGTSGGVQWKVWSTDARVLQVEIQYTYGNAGDYDWTITAKDETAFLTGTSLTVTIVELYAESLVDATGSTSTASFGDWAGLPGTTAAGTNFLKIVNTGTDADLQLNIEFGASFTGSPDSTETFPVNNNIRFAVSVEAAGTTTPPALDPASAGTDADGTIQVTFTAQNQVAFIQYAIDLPDPLKDQDYTTTYQISTV